MMNTKNYFVKFTLSALILLTTAHFAFAQKPNAPRQEKLLNNLKLLMWSEPADKATVKLRIHSGAAFDTLNKEGTMALLADALFPNDSASEFFREELGGSLSVESNYDYIQITAIGDSSRILTILETLATAVTRPQIDKETTAVVRAARLARIKELEKNPSYIADQVVAKRLFGDYPYGKSPEGTSESLEKIDFADLLLAKQRFLTADNATLAVSGNFKPDYVFKVVRQLFGGWEKSDRRVPATFAEPNAVTTKSFLVQTDAENAGELRFAFRGFARKDKDYAASQILTKILQSRFQSKEGNKAAAYQSARFLPGLVVLKVSEWNVGMVKVEGDNVALPGEFFETVGNLLKAEITADEFAKAKTEFAAERSRENTLDAWLDADTYKLVSVKDDLQRANDTTLADIQRIAGFWKKESVATTLVISKAK